MPVGPGFDSPHLHSPLRAPHHSGAGPSARSRPSVEAGTVCWLDTGLSLRWCRNRLDGVGAGGSRPRLPMGRGPSSPLRGIRFVVDVSWGCGRVLGLPTRPGGTSATLARVRKCGGRGVNRVSPGESLSDGWPPWHSGRGFACLTGVLPVTTGAVTPSCAPNPRHDPRTRVVSPEPPYRQAGREEHDVGVAGDAAPLESTWRPSEASPDRLEHPVAGCSRRLGVLSMVWGCSGRLGALSTRGPSASPTRGSAASA